MVVPVKNIVETVDLTSDDVLLPLLECIVNSIISLQQSGLPKSERLIQIKIERGRLPKTPTLDNIKTISAFKIIDNGTGFNSANFKSFETPFSQINKEFGCKGIGRFTVLAAFDEYQVHSNFKEKDKWFIKEFKFTSDKEIELIRHEESELNEFKTIVEIKNCNNENIIEKSALTVRQIAEIIMQHCFIYYLNNSLPTINIIDTENNVGEAVNELFEKVSKEKERDFLIQDKKFKLYITKTLKEGNSGSIFK